MGEGSTTRVRVRLRVCDDSAGNLVVHVSQRRGRAGRLYARGAFSRTFPGAAGRCRSYRFGWRLGARFVGRGLYAVEIRVRDAGGAWSRRVGSVRIGAR